jgi:hypothetical protein
MNAKTPAKKAAAKTPAKKAPAKKAAAASEDNGAAAAEAKREALAILRNIRINPRKINLLAKSIRGLHVEDALDELQFSRKRIAHDLY